MSILSPRITYKPFRYNTAYDFWLKQQNAHWLHTEVSMSSDVQDWKLSLTEDEKNVVGGVLKGFVQTEICVNDYWTNKVSKWFPHPEIVMMATCFGNMETIHTIAYAQLNDTLGLDDYEAFLHEPAASAKLNRLMEIESSEDAHDIARSLAIFSAFTEGVSLFSSFAVLLNFSRFNKLKGLGSIISFSIRDESLHSNARIWLFNQLISEFPELRTERLKKEILEAADHTLALEFSFIDSFFTCDAIEGLTKYELQNFVKHRLNSKLIDLGYEPMYDVDKEALNNMQWFDFLSSGIESQDFFAGRVTAYSKGSINLDNIFD